MSNSTTVASLSGLYQALSNATGGETILLEGGRYGNLSLGASARFPSNVTIASADPSNPAVFASAQIRDAANMTFDSVVFDYVFEAGDNLWDTTINISNSNDIRIINSTIEGDVASGMSSVSDGYGSGLGVSIRGSTGVSIENTEVSNYWKGISSLENSDVTLRANEIYDIRSDGINVVSTAGVTIEGNYIHDFRKSPTSEDHQDMIQFWTFGSDRPSTDIVIRDNFLDIGSGGAAQSIFMRNELVDSGSAGAEMFYQNVLIENNVVVNAHINGIIVGETNGLIVRNNSVLHADGGEQDGADSEVEIPLIMVKSASENVTITGNATSRIVWPEGKSGWTVQGNAFIQDQDTSAPGFYGDVFEPSSLQPVDGVNNFIVKVGGMLDLLNAGASGTGNTGSGITPPPPADSGSTPPPADSGSTPPPADSGSTPPPTDSGSTPPPADSGSTPPPTDSDSTPPPAVSHGTPPPAVSHGTVDSPEPISANAGPELLTYTAGDGFTAYKGSTTSALSVDADRTNGIQLGGDGTAASIERKYVTDVLQSEEFEIAMTLTDSGGSYGEIVRLHGSFIVSVNRKGELLVRATQDDGSKVRLLSSGADLDDGKPHDIAISLKDGTLSISRDGETIGEAPLVGTLDERGRHDLDFGNPWGQTNFSGDLTAFSITTNASKFTADPVSAVAETAAAPAPFDNEDVPQDVAQRSGEDTATAEPQAVVRATWFDALKSTMQTQDDTDIAPQNSGPSGLEQHLTTPPVDDLLV